MGPVGPVKIEGVEVEIDENRLGAALIHGNVMVCYGVSGTHPVEYEPANITD